MKAGAERFQLGPGAAAVVPRGVPHTFRVDSETARVLLLSTPAGIERFVRDASVPAAAPTLPPPTRRDQRPKSSNGSTGNTHASRLDPGSATPTEQRIPAESPRAIVADTVSPRP